jgi:hypothetical protein
MKYSNLEFENFLYQTTQITSQEDGIEISKNIINLLDRKCKAFNSATKKKVSLSNLKRIYKNSIYNIPLNLNRTAHEYAMAKINVYFDILQGNRKFENSSVVNKNKLFFVIDSSIEPSDKDYSLLEEEKITFNNPDNLYLDEPERNTNAI